MSRSQNILLAGEFWFGSTGLGLATALRGAGHYVSEVEMRRHFPELGSFNSKILFRLLIPLLVRSYRKQIVETAMRHQCDIMVAVKGGFIDAVTIERLQSLGVFCVNFYPDVSFDHPDVTLEDQKAYDLLVSTKSFHIDYLKNDVGLENVEFVPHGYSPEVHRPRENGTGAGDYDFDLAFVGSYSAHKENFLTPIFAANTHRRIMLAGNGWHDFAAVRASENFRYVGPMTGDLYARAIERSRINIAIHHGPSGPEGWADMVSTRSFEIPATGGFMMHVDNEEIRSFFDAGTEFIPFSDPAEAIEKIDYYLDHPDERMAIAHKGYERCVPAYGLDVRAAEIMAQIERRLPRKQ